LLGWLPIFNGIARFIIFFGKAFCLQKRFVLICVNKYLILVELYFFPVSETITNRLNYG